MRTASRTPLGRIEERRRLRRVRWMRALFVFGLVAWTSLAAWWATYFFRSYRELREMTMRAYQAEAYILARALAEHPPGALTLPPLFEVAPLPLDRDTRRFPFVTLPPGSPEPTHALVLSPTERVRLHHESRTKLIMLAGEGTVLIGLLFVVFIVLYRMLVSEWRLNRQTEAFVSAVTHELKSPIAGLRALLDTLESLELSANERATYHSLGQVELKRLDRLVNHVLLSSRLEGASYEANPTPISVDALLERLVERKALLAAERGGSVTLAATPTQATFDPDAFEMIVMNLIDNAIKYSEGAPHVRVEAHGGERVRVLVRDDGAGLDEEERRHAFDKFWRSRDADRTQSKGTGLGLFIARELARAGGGDLRVESEGRGKGATFVLELPAGETASRRIAFAFSLSELKVNAP